MTENGSDDFNIYKANFFTTIISDFIKEDKLSKNEYNKIGDCFEMYHTILYINP